MTNLGCIKEPDVEHFACLKIWTVISSQNTGQASVAVNEVTIIQI